VLVHHRDPGLRGLDRIVDHDRPTVDEDLAGVGRHQPEHDVHERRLARAVLTEHAVDLAPQHRQVDVIAGRDRAEPLRDRSDLDRRDRHVGYDFGT
jgi:hypothetical protein